MHSDKNSKRRALIAKVHIAKKDLAMDEESYRDVLHANTKKHSCSDMSLLELENAVQGFRKLGWKPKKRKPYSPKSSNKSNPDQVDKIRAIWIDMHRQGIVKNGSDIALSEWVKRITSRINKGAGVERVEWLRGHDDTLSTKVLESLKQWQNRTTKQWLNEDLLRVSKAQQQTDKPQTDVIRKLLSTKTIRWWPVFLDIGINDHNSYAHSHGEITHG